MKLRVPEVILGVLLAVAVFAMGALFASSKHSDAPQNQSTQASEAKGSQSHEAKSLWIPEDATGFFTLWIAAFTGVLAISTIFLWRSTRDAAIAARTAAEHIPRVERAYLFIGPGQIGVKRNDMESLVETAFAFIELTHFGPTPAFISKIYWEFSPQIPMSENPVYRIGSSWEPDIVIRQEKPFVLPLPCECENTETQYFYGFVQYSDIFKAPHTSRFCIKIHPRIEKWEHADAPPAWNAWD